MHTEISRREIITPSQEVEGVVYPETKTIFTKIEYDINGTKVEIEVAHFNPQSENDILLGIENRAVSEKLKLEE